MSNRQEEIAHWLVKGLVQGVGFRWFVSRNARALDLKGWVRNTEAGDVCVLALGSRERLHELRDSIMRGPPGARVDGIEEIEAPPPQPPSAPFSIIN
jgi:acylphosphatase